MESVKSSVPHYLQIADSLIEQIESGELAPGTLIPSKRKLNELFDFNRLTVRRTLSRLEDQRLVMRKHGKGNFIAEPKTERQTGIKVSITNGMQRRGLAPGAVVLNIEQRPGETAIAEQIDVPVLTTVFYVIRLGMIKQEPVMLEQLWVSVNCFPGLENQGLDNHSVSEIMKTEYGVSMTIAQRSLEPVIATEYEAELLGIEVGAPLILD